MTTQDRAVVKTLLQSMTDSCLFHTEEFRAALKHFNITTTYIGQQVSDEAAVLLGKEHNHFVDVFYPSRIDAHNHGERFWFATKEEASLFEARERMNGDQPTVQDAIEAAHAEALEIDAEFNFERVSREINTPVQTAFLYLKCTFGSCKIADSKDIDLSDILTCESIEDVRDFIDNVGNSDDIASFETALKIPAALWPAVRAEYGLSAEERETVRAVIASALHIAANSFGHVIGEHEDLVETLRNAGFSGAARRVDAIIEDIGGANHKEIRAEWRRRLRDVSSRF